MPYRAVIFDMDGLLVDSEVLIEAAWRQALLESGYDLPHELFIPLVGVHTSVIGQTFEQHFGIQKPDFEQLFLRRSAFLMDMYQTQLTAEYLKPGVVPLLDRLEAAGVPRAIATLTRHPYVEVVLRRTGLDGRFPLVVCGEDVSRPKPEPDIFLETTRRLGFSPEQCIVLEDSAAGILAASRAGNLPILIPDLLQPPPEICALAYARFTTLSEATPEIMRLLANHNSLPN